MNNKALKAGIVLCFGLHLLAFVGLVVTRIPPFSVGECAIFQSSYGYNLEVKILDNDYVSATSELEANATFSKIRFHASFKDLRTYDSIPMDCKNFKD